MAQQREHALEERDRVRRKRRRLEMQRLVEDRDGYRVVLVLVLVLNVVCFWPGRVEPAAAREERVVGGRV